MKDNPLTTLVSIIVVDAGICLYVASYHDTWTFWSMFKWSMAGLLFILLVGIVLAVLDSLDSRTQQKEDKENNSKDLFESILKAFADDLNSRTYVKSHDRKTGNVKGHYRRKPKRKK